MTVAQPRRQALHVANGLFLVVGGLALAWLVRRFGVSGLVRSIRGIGPWALLLGALSLASIALNAAAIRVFMRPESRMVGYWRVVAAQVSGQAINSVTPLATLGEVAKVTMLQGHVPSHRAISSVVAFNIVNIAVKACFVLVALVVSLVFMGFPPQLEWLLRGLLIVLAATGGLLLYATHVGLVRTFTVASELVGIISKRTRKRITKRLGALDDQLRMFGRHREASYTAGFAFIALAQAIGLVDMWILLTATGQSESLAFVIVAAVAGSSIGTLASVVPLGIGTNEGGLAGLFVLLGPGALVGLTIALIARLRTLVIAALGLLVMLTVQILDRSTEVKRRKRTLRRNAKRHPL